MSTTAQDNGCIIRTPSDELRGAIHAMKDEQTTQESGVGHDSCPEGSRKKYSVIKQESREHLLELVLKKRMKIKEAARLCGLKFSTSKAILATYRKEGRVGKKKTRARKTKVINTVIVAEVNPFDPTQTKFIPMVSVSETKMMTNEKESIVTENESKKAAQLVEQAQSAYMKKGVENEVVKDMLELAATNARMSLLQEVQGIMFNLMRTGNPQFALFQVQNIINQMHQTMKMNLDAQLAKRKGVKTKIVQPRPVLPTVEPRIQQGNLPSIDTLGAIFTPVGMAAGFQIPFLPPAATLNFVQKA